MVNKNKLHPVLFQDKPWANNENNIWLASTLCLSRNIDKFHFPSKLSPNKREQIISLVSQELLKEKLIKKPVLLTSDELIPREKEYLFEHFLSQQGFQQAHSGEAFILDSSGQFLATINVDNHIQFELIDCSANLESSWNKMVKIEMNLGKKVNFSFSPHFGFLTSDPGQCGTAFILSLFIQPSALIHTGRIDETLEKLGNDKIAISGLQGNPNEIIGDILHIYNHHTIGVTEENIISSLRLFATKLHVEEKTLRSHLEKDGDPEVMDRVSRAFGILMHSYKIEAAEALNALALLKLGAALNWLTGVTSKEINLLFFNCRRSHLLHQYGDADIESELLLHKRSEYIHKVLAKAKLTI